MLLRTAGAADGMIDGLAAELAAGFDILPIELPAEDGASAAAPATPVAAAAQVLRRISQHASPRWLVCGRTAHSEVVSIVAARALDGTAPVFGLAGVVELTSSPASLEAAGRRVTDPPAYPRASFEAVESSLEAAEPSADPAPRGRLALLADRVAAFADEVALAGPEVPGEVATVIASTRTSSRTRGILARRAVGDDDVYRPVCLTADQLVTLRAFAERVVPQEDGPAIDLAARLDAQLARGEGDGWRNAELPADPEAYALALTALRGLHELAPEDQDALLRSVAASEYSPPASALTAAQLGIWFQDACADLTRLWLAHPASLARAGFDGFASGGDGARKLGFRVLSAGRRESWEPRFDLLRTPGGTA